MNRFVAASFALGFVTIAVPRDAAATEPIANESAQGEARLDPDSVGVPGFGIVVEGGTEVQKITGRAALRYGAYALDVTVSGGSVNGDTARLQLFDALETRPSGALSAGLTWTSFRVEDFEDVIDQVEKLCDEQATEDQAATDRALAEDAAYDAAKARLDLRTQEKTAATTRAAQLDGEAALLATKRADLDRVATDAETRAKSALTAALEIAEAPIPGKTPADRTKEEQARRTAVETARARADMAVMEASSASRRATDARVEAAAADVRAMEAKRTLAAAEAAATEAEAAVDAERRRVIASRPSACAASTLSPARQERVVWPFRPTYIAALRGAFSTQENEYFDPVTTAKSRESSHPWKASAAFGSFLYPTSLVAVSLSYGRTRTTGPEELLCGHQVTEVKTSVPYYACDDLSIGVPAWAQSTAARLELRQFLTAGLSINPSFTFSWTGEEKAPFAPDQGAWKLEMPLYAKASFGADDKALVIGAAYTYGSTWGIDANETRNDVALFLGGGFDIGRL